MATRDPLAGRSDYVRANLWTSLAIRPEYPREGVCNAWMDRADKMCSRPDSAAHPRLCARHAGVAIRKLDARVAEANRARASKQGGVA